MTREVGGYTVEGRYFIVKVPDWWKEMDPLPPPSPDDRWFDRVSHFKAELTGPWIRWPVWRRPWTLEAPVEVSVEPIEPIEPAEPEDCLPLEEGKSCPSS
jgi:hypothetical protein